MVYNTVYPKKYAHGFCFAVLCCGYTLTDFPISIRLTSLALWQSNDCPVPAKQPWWIWINTSCGFIMNDCITTTKQSTTKPCAYFLGYTVSGNKSQMAMKWPCSAYLAYSPALNLPWWPSIRFEGQRSRTYQVKHFAHSIECGILCKIIKLSAHISDRYRIDGSPSLILTFKWFSFAFDRNYPIDDVID